MTTLPLLPLLLDDVPPGLRLALAQEGIPVQDRRAGSPAGRFVLFDSRKGRCEAATGQTAIDVHALRFGFRHDPFESLLDEGSARARWQIGSARVSEEVARVDKRAVRKRLMERLRAALEASGGLWLRISPYPFPYRSAFNFRLDHDAFHPGEFDTVLRTISGHEDSTSHYVCGSTHADQHDALARLRGQDVGSHGYHHHVYFDPRDNLRNIQRGIEMLERAGISPSGYVAPHGRFNCGLLEALDTLGITHSSEFALAYDELPFFPPGSNVLQIPVHPVCLGIFLDALRDGGSARTLNTRIAVELASAYLEQVARARYDAGEPVFLYGHPDGRLGRYPEVLGRVLETVSGFGSIWKTTRSRMGAWWRARAAVQVRVYRDGETYLVAAEQLPARYPLGLEFFRGDHVALMPLNAAAVRFSPGALAYQRRKEGALPQPVRVDRAAGLRGSVRRYLDWEKVTPLEELDARTLRGWLKKTLRRVRN